jgi:hypothetical protein
MTQPTQPPPNSTELTEYQLKLFNRLPTDWFVAKDLEGVHKTKTVLESMYQKGALDRRIHPQYDKAGMDDRSEARLAEEWADFYQYRRKTSNGKS